MRRSFTRWDESGAGESASGFRKGGKHEPPSFENPEPVRTPQTRARLGIRRLLANLRAWLEFAPARNPEASPPHFHTHRCPRAGTLTGSKFAAFWRIFVPGSNLPLRETPTRSPHFHTHRCPREAPAARPAALPAVGHRRHFPKAARVDSQGAAMVRGVFHHGPYDVADGLAAHDGPGREWP